MKANHTVIKRIAKSLQILQYITDLKSYQLKVVFEYADKQSVQTFVLPEQYFYPYAVVSMDLCKTQPIKKEIAVQGISIIGNKKVSPPYIQSPSFQEERQSEVIQTKSELDFDILADQPQNYQYLQNLKREVMRVRVKRGRKKIKP